MKKIIKNMIPYVILIINLVSFGCEEDLLYIENEQNDSTEVVTNPDSLIAKQKDSVNIVNPTPVQPQPATVIIEKANYYVSPNGNDENPGTIDKPFKTWDKVIDVVKPGDLVYLRGGTYYKSSRNKSTACYLVGKSGAAGKYIRMWAYPGENPVLDCRTMNLISGSGLYLGANYWHIKGIEIKNVPQGYDASNNVSTIVRGLTIQNASYNIIENIKIHDVSGIGIGMSGASTKNLIKNSDFYNNYDKLTRNTAGAIYLGGNGDGAHLRAEKGSSNTIKGCRFYKNSDDGIDLWQNEGVMIIDSCWSFNNGYDMGDGNGFKLGRTDAAKESYSQRLVYHCLSYANKAHGFDQNNANVIMTFYNNTAYANKGKGYYLSKFNLKMTFANNISVSNALEDNFTEESVMTNNSWNGFKASSSDFESLDASELLKPRKENGNLPDIKFLSLTPSSALVDKGKVLSNFPYLGSAPDIGVFEKK